MIGLLVALYPARWRERYGEEFRAMLESRPLGPFDVADVLLGVLDARLTRFRLPGTASGGPQMLLRMGGLGAIVGGAAWFVGIAGSSALGGDSAWLAIAVVGTVGLLVALVGLSAFQAHRNPILAWAAFGIPAIGTAAALLGSIGMALRPAGGPILGMASPWEIWILGTMAMLIGSILFAAATLRARVLSRRAAQALAGASLAVLVVALGSIGLGEPPAFAPYLLALSLAAFGGSWMWLGLSALRRGPIQAIAAA